jgi:hypothetical protein
VTRWPRPLIVLTAAAAYYCSRIASKKHGNKPSSATDATSSPGSPANVVLLVVVPEAPTVEFEPEDDDIVAAYLWKVARLEEAGFDHFSAYRLSFNDCDWHEAARMLRAGASQEQILDILL